VGIPSLTPNFPGAAPPMTPMERLRHARKRAPSLADKDSADADDSPSIRLQTIESTTVRLLSTKDKDKRTRTKAKASRHLEKHWHQCLSYPLRAWWLCLWVAVIMAFLSAGIAVILPPLLADPPTDPWRLGIFRFVCLMLLLATFGVPSSFQECVLSSAAEGEVHYILWSGNLWLTILICGAKWLACFVVGPLLFAAIGCLYWIRCGDPSPLDWLILVELGVVAVGLWIYTVLSVTDRCRWLDLNPLAVADLAHRLGWQGFVAVLAASLLFLVHLVILVNGIADVHVGKLKGWMMLGGGWLSGVFWSTFFSRLLGIWLHRSRREMPEKGEDEIAKVQPQGEMT
jgi:hypothetical protein